MDNSIYLKSIEILKKKAPLLKALLQFAPKELNTLDLDFTSEKKSNFNLLAKEKVKVCFIYEVNPKELNQIEEWLNGDSSRKVLFFEEDLSSLKRLLCLKAGYSLIKKCQVELFYLKAPNFWEQNQKKMKSFLGMPFEILSGNQHENSFNEFKNKLTTLCLNQNSLFTEYLFTSPLFYQNAFKNLYSLQDCFFSHKLKNQFLNHPAIICGAGPSINRDAPLLKKLTSKALIFAGGRALSVLNSENIEPHFTLGIDPYQMHHETYSQNNFFNAPFLYRMRVNSDALDKAHGTRLYTPHAIGYPLISHIEEKLKLRAPKLQEGLNVVNFSLQLAHFFGCDPIILVGCDLAYDNKNAYSKSVVLNQSLPQKGQIDSKDYSIHRGVFQKNIQGKEVYTLWKWSEEAKWMAEFAKTHPDRTYLNATLTGLNIDGFESTPLLQISQEHLKINRDLYSTVFQAIITQENDPISKEEIDLELKETFESLEKCKYLLNQILEKSDKGILEKDELEGEIAYKKMLVILSDLFIEVEQEKNLEISEQKRYAFLLSFIEKYLKLEPK